MCSIATALTERRRTGESRQREQTRSEAKDNQANFYECRLIHAPFRLDTITQCSSEPSLADACTATASSTIRTERKKKNVSILARLTLSLSLCQGNGAELHTRHTSKFHRLLQTQKCASKTEKLDKGIKSAQGERPLPWAPSAHTSTALQEQVDSHRLPKKPGLQVHTSPIGLQDPFPLLRDDDDDNNSVSNNTVSGMGTS